MQPPLTLTLLGLLGLLPNAVQAPAIELFSRKGSLVASNVPGPQAPLYLCGQRIEEVHFWVPQSGSIGVGVSILSYAGKVFFGLIAARVHRRAGPGRRSPGPRVRTPAARGDGGYARPGATRIGKEGGEETAGRTSASAGEPRRPPRARGSRRAPNTAGNTQPAD